MDAMTALRQRIERSRAMAQERGEDAPVYQCSKCNDTEYILRVDENGLTYGARCTCFEAKAAARLLKASGISESDSKKGFADFETMGIPALENAVKTATEYYMKFDKIRETRHNSIMFCGASGRGKTTLGMALANNFIRKKCIGVRYTPYRDEMTLLKQEIRDEYTYHEHMGRIKNASILFIDDLLKGKVTESDINILYEIVNHRYLAKLPMIISTEKTPRQLVDFDEAIGSRLLEMCNGNLVVFDESVKNYRTKDFF